MAILESMVVVVERIDTSDLAYDQGAGISVVIPTSSVISM